MSRVVVVGGGLGGTASAVRLAKLGHQVTLLERRDELGGALAPVELDGYRWDADTASTTLPAVLRDLFRKSGRPLERELELVPVPARVHHFEDGTELALPTGSRGDQLDAVDAALGMGLGRQWVDHVHGHADAWDLLRRSVLERPWSAADADDATRTLLRTRVSLRRKVHRELRDERLRELALLPSRLEGQDPRDVPWWVGTWSYVEQNFGVWTVPGGMGLLVEALGHRLDERRVDVRLGTTVRDLRVSGGAVTGVVTDAGALDAEVVVVAIEPRRLPVLAPFKDRSMPAIPPTLVHLGLEGDVPDLPPEVVLHGDPTLVVRTTGTAPPGGAAWTVLARGLVSQDVVVDLAHRGLDVRDRVRVRVDRTPRDQVEQLAGSSYGVRWQGRATLERTLGRPPIEGLLLAGASATIGAQLPLVGLTATVVAERLGSAGPRAGGGAPDPSRPTPRP